MAIATFERDPARDTGTTDLRFRLLQELCRSSEAGFWRAIDQRSGKACVVRVIDADRDQSSRRLGDLHRERTLAERIGHPSVLRTDVPTIEDDRIFQIVDPEPARSVEIEAEGGRLAVLNLLVAAAAVLADAHARGVFHGAFSRASCLRTGDGRLLVHGFLGDAASAAAIRDGAAADHRAFLELATEMLRGSGGAPPRLRRYFSQHLNDGAPSPASAAMAELCADLRESLEDTFPWPIAALAPAGSEPVSAAALAPVPRELRPDGGIRAGRPVTDAAVPAVLPVSARGPDVALPAASVAAAPPLLVIVPPFARAPEPVASPAACSPVPAARDAASPQTRTPLPVVTAKPSENRQPAAAHGDAKPAPEVPSSGRSLRPWLAAIVVIGLAALAIQYGAKRRETPSAPVAAPIAAPVAAPMAAPAAASAVNTSVDERTAVVAGAAAAAEVPANPAPRVVERETAPPSPMSATGAPARAPSAPAAPAAPVAAAPRQAVVVAPRNAEPAPRQPGTDSPSPQAIRSRVTTLVAGGNRALTALEPGAAGEAFAAALALAPDDRAALDGAQRARRLQGVAALMRDAREASARGDHARAVQGYAQALSNDPRNRGLADALATARRNLGRDANSALLAEGHAALGAGRFEAARAAFEKALAADPEAPGARRAAEQASTAILLRDAAESRRAEIARNDG